MTKDQICDMICNMPMFSSCARSDIKFTKAAYKRGDDVTDRPGGVPCVGIVAAGEIGVYSVSEAGRSSNVSVLTPTDMFGICNVFARRRMPTTLKCISKCTVAYMLKDDFAALMLVYPDMALRYAELCNEKIQFLAGKLEFLNISSVRRKLCLYLIRAAEDGSHSVCVSSKELLAMYLGVSRASLFRELAYLRGCGAIIVERDRIVINDLDKLNKCCSG